VHLRVGPVDELAVHPDLLGFLHLGIVLSTDLGGPDGLKYAKRRRFARVAVPTALPRTGGVRNGCLPEEPTSEALTA
jgi:hypothetical protein